MESGKRKRKQNLEQDKHSTAENDENPTKIIKVLDAKSMAEEYWQQYQSMSQTNPESRKKRFECLQNATDFGHIQARYELARAFAHGNGCEKNESKAYNLCFEAAHTGHAEAQFEFAITFDSEYYPSQQLFVGSKKDDSTALKWYLEAAKQGHTGAQTAVGCAYKAGIGCSIDESLAVYWFLQGVKQKDELACYNLGLYMKGTTHRIIQPVNSCKILKYARTLSKTKDPLGHYLRGLCHEYKHGTAENIQKAEKYLLRSANQHCRSASYELFYLYKKKNDNVQALKWLKMAAESGLDSAQFKYALSLNTGEHGQVVDYAAAKEWFTKAANQDHINAQMNLAWMYYNGEGVAKDTSTAIVWWMTAALLGCKDAQFNVADAYSKGEGGLDVDFQKSFEWFSKAAEQKDGKSACYCGEYIAQGKVAESKDKTQCIPWFRKAIEYGCIEGAYKLAHFFDHNSNISSEYKHEILSLYLQAAEKGHREAQCAYGEKLFYGQGIDRDEKKGMEWLQKAVRQGSEHAKNIISKIQSGLPIQQTLFQLNTVLEQIQEMKQQLTHLQQAHQTQQEQTLCFICYIERPNWCLPCHHVICADCKDKLQVKTCPKCRISFQINPGHSIFY